MGLAAAEALISIRTIEALHYQTMTTLNLVISLVLGVAVFGASNQIARLFSEPELGAVLRWMALLPLLSAFCAAPLAASKRELRFRPIALRSIAGLVAGGVVGLALALLGAGVWSLVAQAMVQRSVSAIVLWAAVPLKVRLVVSLRHFQDLQRFAATMMLSPDDETGRLRSCRGLRSASFSAPSILACSAWRRGSATSCSRSCWNLRCRSPESN